MLESRIVRIALATAITAIGAAASKGFAQTAAPKTSGWEVSVTSGKLLPTGADRDVFKKAGMSAMQLTYVTHANYAITGMVGWARSRDIATAGSPKLDVFTYDVGAEVRTNVLQIGAKSTLRPFAGLGAGGRTYNYRSLDVDATHNAAAYGSLGGELGVRRVHLRTEVRDYVTGMKPLSGVAGKAETRNDVSVLFGLHIASR